MRPKHTLLNNASFLRSATLMANVSVQRRGLEVAAKPWNLAENVVLCVGKENQMCSGGDLGNLSLSEGPFNSVTSLRGGGQE